MGRDPYLTFGISERVSHRFGFMLFSDTVYRRRVHVHKSSEGTLQTRQSPPNLPAQTQGRGCLDSMSPAKTRARETRLKKYTLRLKRETQGTTQRPGKRKCTCSVRFIVRLQVRRWEKVRGVQGAAGHGGYRGRSCHWSREQARSQPHASVSLTSPTRWSLGTWPLTVPASHHRRTAGH